MASCWNTKRKTKQGAQRYRVEYRAGGREAPTRYGGSFSTQREALERKSWISGELAARRVPDLRWHEPTSPTFAQAARNWQAARIDVADSTRDQHRIQLDKLLPLIGSRRIDTL